MRCVTCGRLPDEPCCDHCHMVHRRLWETTAALGQGRYTTLARHILKDLTSNDRSLQ